MGGSLQDGAEYVRGYENPTPAHSGRRQVIQLPQGNNRYVRLCASFLPSGEALSSVDRLSHTPRLSCRPCIRLVDPAIGVCATVWTSLCLWPSVHTACTDVCIDICLYVCFIHMYTYVCVRYAVLSCKPMQVSHELNLSLHVLSSFSIPLCRGPGHGGVPPQETRRDRGRCHGRVGCEQYCRRWSQRYYGRVLICG